jgi:hypothetical protein
MRTRLTIDHSSFVKELLPDVTVRIDNNIYPACTSGRNNQFASVSVTEGPYEGMTFDVSWQTVNRSFERKTPIIFR